MNRTPGYVYLPAISGVFGLLVVVAGASAGLELAAIASLLFLLAVGLVGSGVLVRFRGRLRPGS